MFPTASMLHVVGVLALDLTAIAVLVCCLHARRAHGMPAARHERPMLALALLAVVLAGLTTSDLVVIAVTDLALMGVVAVRLLPTAVAAAR